MKKSIIFKSRNYFKIFNNTLKIANKRFSLIKIIRGIKNTIKLKLVSNIAIKVELFFYFFGSIRSIFTLISIHLYICLI